MKVITEALIRDELRATEPDVYYLEPDKILSPAAREYLLQKKVRILKQGESDNSKDRKTQVREESVRVIKEEPKFTPKYVDYLTGAYYLEKPENMTQLSGNILVPKNHKRIIFRGKLDSLQSLIIVDQVIIAEGNCNKKLNDDLTEILNILREMMRCDALEEEFKNETILGLNHEKLHEHSHNPMRFYNIKQMLLPDYKMGKEYALLNQLRTAIRETEIAAIEASKEDFIEELNRLSSAIHIMMCMYLAGIYR